MINLRTRLLVGYGYMTLLLLFTAGSAAFGFFTISEAIDRILSENFRSVSASVDMMDALERESALTMQAMLAGSLGDEEVYDIDQVFRSALDAAKDNVTLEGEAELLESIEESFIAFQAVRGRVFEDELEEMPLEIFANLVFPSYLEVRRGVVALLEANHQAIIVADREARETALQMAGWLGFMVTLALFSMVLLARELQRKILARLDELRDVAESLITGDHSRRFEAGMPDELGLVSRQLNSALDARDELQAEMRGRLNQQKQLVLGLLSEVQGELLLLGLDGQLIASNCETLKADSLEPVRKWLLDNRRFVLQSFRDGERDLAMAAQPGGIPLSIRLLAAEGRRPVGWLIQIRRDEVDDSSEWTREEGRLYEEEARKEEEPEDREIPGSEGEKEGR